MLVNAVNIGSDDVVSSARRQANVWIHANIGCILNPSPQDKMAAIFAHIFICIFLNENEWIPIQISLKYVPRSPIDKKL